MSNPHSLIVTFYTEAVQSAAKSEEAGRPIYINVPFVRIIIPGDSRNIIERKATEDDKRRFQAEYDAYIRGEKESESGTPLETWPPINKAQVKEAKYFEVHTVEALANLSDINAQRLGMGFAELRTKAKAYLLAAADGALVAKQAAENERLHSEMQALKEQFADLKKIEDFKKKNGRNE